jgi:hypothetical protein
MLHGPRSHAFPDLVVLERVFEKGHGLDKTAFHLFHDALFSRVNINDDKLHVRAMGGVDMEPFGNSKIAGAGRPDAMPSEDAGTKGQVLQAKQGVGAIPVRAIAGRQPGRIATAGRGDQFIRNWYHSGQWAIRMNPRASAFPLAFHRERKREHNTVKITQSQQKVV